MNELSDAEREDVICVLAQLAQGSQSSAIRHHWFGLMRQEVARRSAEQVARLNAYRTAVA